jgi:23S rRNA (uridine2552-2'-O)-methyltransferase
MGKSRTQSSHDWLRRQEKDPYVKEAKRLGYRSRAVFKLLELQEKHRFIKPGMTIVDLGAAPGGWSETVQKITKNKGRIVALDILPMESIESVDFIQGDFTEDAVLDTLMTTLNNEAVDVVLSDMAPNFSGVKQTDQARSMILAEYALDFALKTLKPRGAFLVKAFQGADFDLYLKTLRDTFKQVIITKPKSSRQDSREMYLFCATLK